jgi:zinc transporter 1/2/3
MVTSFYLIFALAALMGLITSTQADSAQGGTTTASADEPNWPLLRAMKISMIVVIFFETLGASMLPWWFHRSKHAMMILNFGSCLSAGLILGLGLCHLDPNAASSFVSYFAIVGPVGLARAEDVTFPFSDFIAGITLLVLVFVENLATVHTHTHGHSHGFEAPPDDDHKLCRCHRSSQTDPRVLRDSCCGSDSGKCEDIAATDMRIVSATFTGTDLLERMCLSPQVCPAEDCMNMCPSDVPENSMIEFPSSTADAREVELENSSTPNNEETMAHTTKKDPIARGSRDQVIRAWVFCFALSLHSLFDGLSVGSETETKQFIAFVIAIVSHKFFDGFVVGVSMYLGRLPFWHTAAGLVFCAAMTPLGIGIAWAITSVTTGAGLLLAQALILSVSMGTFLFISIVELLPQGLADGRYRPLKVFVAMVGFGIMAVIAIWA